MDDEMSDMFRVLPPTDDNIPLPGNFPPGVSGVCGPRTEPAVDACPPQPALGPDDMMGAVAEVAAVPVDDAESRFIGCPLGCRFAK
jgi:hypothetical protein